MEDIGSPSDDFVASLLAEDGKKSSVKYSALGVGAFLPAKVPTNKPKPNTRFLRNIIQETDNHNATLLAKEAAEAKSRLENLAKKDTSSASFIRSRQLGHIAAHLTGRAKIHYRFRDEDEDSQKLQQNERNIRKAGSDDDSQGGRRKDKHRESHMNERKTAKEEKEGRSQHRSHKRRRSRSEEGRSKRSHKNKVSHSRSPSPEKHRSKKSKHVGRSSERDTERTTRRTNDREDTDKERKRSRRHQQSPSPEPDDSSRKKSTKSHRKASQAKDEEDSDPLENFLGPIPARAPKVVSRGRGTRSSASGIDFHFSSGYDPSADVALDPGEQDDWGNALEALRDRQKWRQQGADRLRAAGFTEEMIGKWEKSGEDRMQEKGINDVKWAKRGEGREWDKGKVFSPDSGDEAVKDVDLNFGRLKGT